jgi:2-dehydropantoate 2-reductase
MRTLIVGVGALGGVLAARLQAIGTPAALATRSAASAASLKTTGLRVTGIGGAVSVAVDDVATVDDYAGREGFDLVVLATKARDAIDVAPRAASLLRAGGTLLPIQNGGVAELLAARLGHERVLGGLSNLGATMTSPGVYEQRNAGHLLIGELAGGGSPRVERVRGWLGRAVETRCAASIRGAVWSKLLVNCAVTTLGAVAGLTMRGFIDTPAGRALFDRTYEETLAVALASGATPARMLVDPIPPPRPGGAYEAWLGEIVRVYGDLKPSMLQDFERGRATEIDFINGYVESAGQERGVSTPTNTAIAEAVRAITRGELAPDPSLLERILDRARRADLAL